MFSVYPHELSSPPKCLTYFCNSLILMRRDRLDNRYLPPSKETQDYANPDGGKTASLPTPPGVFEGVVFLNISLSPTNVSLSLYWNLGCHRLLACAYYYEDSRRGLSRGVNEFLSGFWNGALSEHTVCLLTTQQAVALLYFMKIKIVLIRLHTSD